MGSTYSVECPKCSFKRKSLSDGFGMAGPQYNMVCAPCFTCKLVRSISIASEDLRCKKCDRELDPYVFRDGDRIIFDFKEDYESYPPLKKYLPCPRCKTELDIVGIGHWD